MAVNITTKFYAAAAWKDLAKIVFTSPSLTNPGTAGTRSHILPGGGIDPALWYEDSTNMYRLEETQYLQDDTFFGYIGYLSQDFDYDNPPLYIDLVSINKDNWLEFMRKKVDNSYGSWPIKYSEIVISGSVTISGSTVVSGYNYSDCVNNTGWRTDEDNNQWIDIEFPSPKAVSKVSFGAVDNYEPKYFILKAKNSTDLDYTNLYSSGQLKYYEDGTYWYQLTQIFNVSNLDSYTSYRLYFPDKFVSANGIGIGALKLYQYAEDVSVTNPTYLYIDQDNMIKALTADISSSVTTSGVRITIDQFATQSLGTGTVASGTAVYLWGWEGGSYTTFYNRAALGTYITLTPTAKTISLLDVTTISGGNQLILRSSNLPVHASTISSVSTTSGTVTLTTGPTTSGTYYNSDITIVDTATSRANVNMQNSVVFEVTSGECYNCRLTAWDDGTHSTTLNSVLQKDWCKVSALAFNCTTASKTDPIEKAGVSFVYAPIFNRIFKGNTVYGGTNYFYGDFNLRYRGSLGDPCYGDFLIFKPILYPIDATITYGVHDFLIVLHYSYS